MQYADCFIHGFRHETAEGKKFFSFTLTRKVGDDLKTIKCLQVVRHLPLSAFKDAETGRPATAASSHIRTCVGYDVEVTEVPADSQGYPRVKLMEAVKSAQTRAEMDREMEAWMAEAPAEAPAKKPAKKPAKPAKDVF